MAGGSGAGLLAAFQGHAKPGHWARFQERLAVLLQESGILHPYPDVRFDAQYPR
jgi:hypothetical protein